MGAPAAAEAPVLGYIAIGLLAALAYCVFVGLRFGWEHTFGAIFESIASVKINLRGLPDIHPFAWLHDANRSVMNALEAGADKSQHAMGYLFHGAAIIQGWIARELVGLARDTLAWADWFQHAHLPKWLKAMAYALFPPLLIHRLVKAAIAAELPHLGRVVITKVQRQTVTRVVKVIAATAGAVALPGWVLHLPKRVRTLEHERTHIWRRFRKLEVLLGATGAAALLARALGVSSARCFRDGNIGRAARRFCGLDSSLVESMLLDLVAVVSVVSVVEFAEDLRAIEDEAIAVFGAMIREWPS